MFSLDLQWVYWANRNLIFFSIDRAVNREKKSEAACHGDVQKEEEKKINSTSTTKKVAYINCMLFNSARQPEVIKIRSKTVNTFSSYLPTSLSWKSPCTLNMPFLLSMASSNFPLVFYGFPYRLWPALVDAEEWQSTVEKKSVLRPRALEAKSKGCKGLFYCKGLSARARSTQQERERVKSSPALSFLGAV